LTVLFDRSRCSGLERQDPLTVSERRHVVDIILAMVSILLASGTLPDHLQPLLNFISYNADFEWDQASVDVKDGDKRQARTGTRHERYLANIKAATVLLCILQIRPDVPGLTESFAKCCSGELGVAGWILCCLVNNFDDEIRSIGLRCLSVYLDKTAPGEDAMLTAEALGNSSHSQGHSTENAHLLSPSLTSTRLLSSRRLTNTISTMGKGLADAIGSSGALSQIMHSSKVSVKVVYKLLWHLLKCHRERSEKFTHAALLQILLEDPSICSLDEFVIKDDALHHSYRIDIKSAEISSLSLGSYSDENLRQTPAINTVLRLLRFLPSYWREQWLQVFVEISSSSRANVEILSSSSEWQPPLFHLVSDVAEEMTTICSPAKSTLDVDLSHRSDIKSSFDLSFKLYANVLGHCFRRGGEQVRI
jgi:hypothetical protein